MRKDEQTKINSECKTNYITAFVEFQQHHTNWVRLRSCSADVCLTTNYVLLRSYSTVVAVIDMNTDTLYDVLRMVYGYTSTSAQHIAKFRHDYGNRKFGCEREFRYYPL